MRKPTQTLLAVSALVLGGCASSSGGVEGTTRSNEATGVAVGAAVGAAAGALSGDDTDERRKRAIIGAGVGVLAGLGVGAYMDNQEARLRQDLAGTGVAVERRGEDLILNMPGNITFDVGRDEVQPAFLPVLESVSSILEEYDQTTIDVIGHTDSSGNADSNLQLSERRAQSVGDYLQEQGLAPLRLAMGGVGAAEPVADNGTIEGRQLNRRVELVLKPLAE